MRGEYDRQTLREREGMQLVASRPINRSFAGLIGPHEITLEIGHGDVMRMMAWWVLASLSRKRQRSTRPPDIWRSCSGVIVERLERPARHMPHPTEFDFPALASLRQYQARRSAMGMVSSSRSTSATPMGFRPLRREVVMATTAPAVAAVQSTDALA